MTQPINKPSTKYIIPQMTQDITHAMTQYIKPELTQLINLLQHIHHPSVDTIHYITHQMTRDINPQLKHDTNHL